MATISVVMTAYNAAGYIRQSIINILSQTYEDFVLIIVDDGSTDATADVIGAINDPRIEFWRQPHSGRTPSLNFALNKVRSEYIAIMDADDLCVPWKFERQLSTIRKMPKNTILSSWYGIFSGSTLDYCVRTPLNSDAIKKGLLLYSYISHSGILCRTELLKAFGGYKNDVDIDAFEDYQTWLKIKDHVNFAILPEILVYQRFRTDSLTNNILYKQRIMYSIQKPYYNDLMQHFGITSPLEEALYRGWREYFYGSKKSARHYWMKMGFQMLRRPRLVLAWVLTFLPDRLLVRFKQSNVKFRLQYLAGYFSSDMRRVRKEFDRVFAACL